MENYSLGEIERRFADIIWQHEPLSSRELTVLAERELSWKKSTTYTILRRLCDRGLFQNRSGVVTSLIKKDEWAARQSEQFVEENFHGSLPAFLAAFTSTGKLSGRDVEELQKIIDSMKE